MSYGTCVVVGGGLTGLIASLVAKTKFKTVYVVEKDDVCGGLLRSVQDKNGIWFDLGTHVPNATRVPEIDELLFDTEGSITDQWNALGCLRTGNYFGGAWNFENPTVDARALPREVYERGVVELLERAEPSNATDIVSYLVQTLGPTFTTSIVAPIAAKLYGAAVDLSALTRGSSVSYFGLSRLVALNPTLTAKLKELPAFDAKLGYHTRAEWQARQVRDGIEEPRNYYPKHGKGVMFWIESLVSKAKANGVEFIMGEQIAGIQRHRRTATGVTLGGSGRQIACDAVVWSAPPLAALKAAALAVPSTELRFKTANIYHYSYDKPLANRDSHYLWLWDPKYKSFRITLYPNLRTDVDLIPCLTAEVLSDKHDADATTLSDVHKEMVEIGLVPGDATILTQSKQTIHNTFPVPTFEFARTMKTCREALEAEFDNLMLCGRYGGNAWFHKDVAYEVYDGINRRWG